MIRRLSKLLFALVVIVVTNAHAGEDELKVMNKIVGTWRLVAASPTSPLQAGYITTPRSLKIRSIRRFAR